MHHATIVYFSCRTCHVSRDLCPSNEYSKERMCIVMKRCILLVITVLILKTDAGKYKNELNHAYIKWIFFFKCHHLGLKQHEVFFLKRVNLIIQYVTYNIVIKIQLNPLKTLRKISLQRTYKAIMYRPFTTKTRQIKVYKPIICVLSF